MTLPDIAREKRLAYGRRWHLENKERLNAAAKRRYYANRDARLLKQKAYIAAIKDTPEYHERRRRYQAARRNRIRKWTQAIKSGLSCAQCGESRAPCLDFHHLDPSEKEFNVSTAIGTTLWTKEKIQKELSKCIVLCANCHRVTHHNERA